MLVVTDFVELINHGFLEDPTHEEHLDGSIPSRRLRTHDSARQLTEDAAVFDSLDEVAFESVGAIQRRLHRS